MAHGLLDSDRLSRPTTNFVVPRTRPVYSKLTDCELCSVLLCWQIDLANGLEGWTLELFTVPTEMPRPWESCLGRADFPASLPTPGLPGTVKSLVRTPACMYVQAPFLTLWTATRLATLQVKNCLYWRCDLPSGGWMQERGLRQTLEVELLGQGILRSWVLGAWSGSGGGMDSGGPWILGHADGIPHGAGCSRRRTRIGPWKQSTSVPRPLSESEGNPGVLSTGTILEKARRQMWDLCKWLKTRPVSTP